MNKRFVSLILLSCIALTGCVSRAEYNALEERVSRLEQNSGYTYTGQNASAEHNNQAPLSAYINNWDEVITILEQEYGRSDFTITEDTDSMNVTKSDASIKNFGNGTYFIFVDGTRVKVDVVKNVAIFVIYDDGEDNHRIKTPSYTDELYYGH